MSWVVSLAALVVLQTGPQDRLLAEMRTAIGSGVPARVESLFARKSDAKRLIEMAGSRGGLRAVEPYLIATPPGWEGTGPYWAVFSTFQDIQDHTDVVVRVVRTPEGFKLGSEVPESTPQAWRIESAVMDAVMVPEENTVQLRSILNMRSEPNRRAPVFRLNTPYRPYESESDSGQNLIFTATSDEVASPPPRSLVKVGGLLIWWTTDDVKRLEVEYYGKVNTPREDKITPTVAYITSGWVPTIRRLPFPTQVRVTAPEDWTVFSEGVPVPLDQVDEEYRELGDRPGQKTWAFRNDIPISFPKIVGGKYTLAAEIVDGGRRWQSWQLQPVEKERAEKDVARIRDSIRWFEERFGKFPYPTYAVVDADTYYGIESYSYTLLNRSITTRFVSHEIGHTYFGGLVPAPYVVDSWSEGVTQYVDSVLFDQNRDRTLENGLRTLDISVPLTQMSVPHELRSASYWRGAYVMRMLENEIGLPAVLQALREMVDTRRGKDTTWMDLRAYFEKSSNKKLDGFWRQWIQGSTFPTLQVTGTDTVVREGKRRTFVTVRQSGTPTPFRVRFAIVARRGPQTERKEVVMEGASAQFSVDSDFVPTQVELDVFGLSLARVVTK